MRRLVCAVGMAVATAIAAHAEVRVLAEDGTSLRLEYNNKEPCPYPESVLVGIPAGARPTLAFVDASPPASPCEEVDAGTPAVRLEDPGRLRRQHVLPVTFDPGGIGYGRVEVELHFPGPGSIPGVHHREPRGEADVYRRLLVNPGSARRWRRSAPGARPAARPAATGPWYRLTVTETGVHRLRADELPGWQGGASASLAIHAADATPLRPKADSLARARQPVAIVVDDGGDGTFEGDDELLFYGEAPSTWVTRDSVSVWRHHPFTRRNHYWLATQDGTAALRLPDREAQPGFADTTVVTYFAWDHFEEESTPTYVASGSIPSGNEWYWLPVTAGEREVIHPALTNPAGGRLSLRARVMSNADVTGRLRILWNGLRIGAATINPRDSLVWQGRASVAADTLTGSFGLSPISGGQLLLDWLELGYVRQLRAVSGRLRFAGFPGATSYRVSGVSSSPQVFAIDAAGGLARVVGVDYDPETQTALFTDSGVGEDLRFSVVESGRLRGPVAITATGPPDELLATYSGADYVIITPGEFRGAAERLAAWRAVDDRFGPPLRTAVVDVQRIYDAFSGGLVDPTAIRNFLTWSFTHAPAPRFVVLFGDGSYDYRNNTGIAANSNWIPPFEDGHSTYDEFYARAVGADGLSDLAIGRLTVNSADEAAATVDKLIDYDRRPESGPWRSRLLMVADDTFNPDVPERVERSFVVSSELMASLLPDELDVEKLYLVEYPREGRFKPRARDDFIDAINDGAVLLTWIGHGNSTVFAHEHIFVIPQDLPALNNGRRLPFLYAAASQMGVFDDPARDSMPEALLGLQGGGVIGMIAATRIGFQVSNVDLANRFQKFLFEGGWRSARTVGEALWEAKLVTRSNPTNVRRYSLFGDPAMHLALPEWEIQIDVPDTLRAFQRVRIEGRVLREGRLFDDFDGTVRLRLFDSASQRRPVEQELIVSYSHPGSPLFRGRYDVSGGRFEAIVPLPKDITYRGRRARVSAIAFAEEGSAFGANGGIVLSGTDASAPVDNDGPQIDIGFSGRTFAAGDRVPSGSQVHLVLRDESGINITGEVGHGILLRVGNQRLDVTDDYEAQEDYRVGEIRLDLPSLDPGPLRIEVEAWDTRNNWSSAALDFVLTDAEALSELAYYPNPQRQQEGVFSYRLETANDGVRIAVYTISGRRVDVVRGPGGAGVNQIAWAVPEGLANGVYPYVAETVGAGFSGSARGVLVVARGKDP